MKEVLYLSGAISAPTKEGVEANINRMLDAAITYTQDNPDAVPFLPGENNGRLGEQLGWGWKDYMKADLAVLRKADTIFMVDGWKESRGAKIEHRLARMWGKGVIYEKKRNGTTLHIVK